MMKRVFFFGLISFSALALATSLEAQTRERSAVPQIALSAGTNLYNASSDFFQMVERELAISAKDFRTVVLGAELMVPVPGRLGVVFGADGAQRTVASAAVRAVGAPQTQETRLKAWAAYSGLSLRLLELPRAWDPYLVLTVGGIHHDLVQDGDFVDRRDASDEFGHRYTSSGLGWMTEGGVGLNRVVSGRASLNASLRYRMAEATMREDFAGFRPLEMSGWRVMIGAGVRVGRAMGPVSVGNQASDLALPVPGETRETQVSESEAQQAQNVEESAGLTLPASANTEPVCLATGQVVASGMVPETDSLGGYAETAEWFLNDSPIVYSNRTYTRVGTEVRLDCETIRQVGAFHEVPLFADIGVEAPTRRIYVPVRPGVWRIYETDLARVRGD